MNDLSEQGNTLLIKKYPFSGMLDCVTYCLWAVALSQLMEGWDVVATCTLVA